MAAAPIEVGLRSNPETTLLAKAIDERSNETTLVLVGLKGEIYVIARDNIAAIKMDPNAADEFFGTQLADAGAGAAT